MTTSRRAGLGLLLAAAALVVAAAARLLSGSSGFGWPDDAIVRFRVNALATAASVGAALAVAGLFLQVLLRNALASPFVLGLSSGAGLGYMLALYVAYAFGVEMRGVLGVAAPTAAATVGSVVTLAIVWRLGVRRGVAEPLTLVLSGVVVGAIASAGSTALQSLVPTGLRGEFVGWMTGRIPDAPPLGLVATVGLLAVLSTAVGTWLAPALDAAMLSDDEAASTGVSIPRLRAALFVLSGVLTAACVALAGPIAFVGLVAPHAARVLMGARHRPLVAGSALAGAALLVAADAIRQAIDLGGGRLPVGVLTALVGGPVFLALLRSRSVRVSGGVA